MAEKLTFLRISELALLQTKLPLSSTEIWEKANELGITNNFKSNGKTPSRSIGAQIYVDMRDNPNSLFYKVSRIPTKFGLKKLLYTKEDISLSKQTQNDITTPASKLIERDLHALLVKFAYSNQHFKAYLKTILHENSSKNKKGYNKWLHPDLVGVYFPFNDYEQNTLLLQKHLLINPIKLFSFEIKISLSLTNLREYYFQAVSNSSWANEGYLVVLNLEEDEDLFDEIRRLNNSFGIGLIKLNPQDIYSSQILFPSRTSNKIDWDTVDRITSENCNFSDFIKDISDDIQLKQVKSKYDNVLTDNDFEDFVKEKFK